ncbi:response regulator ArlR [Marinitoga sp. 1135]|uniref:Response regulator with CheY-like receiver domain and winged-helix DNA-binding domain n=1 Tax=Marinitoga piezophila (strain DSM 14283 / JCM 11233 / KA3) TaxID=443254 RepID=H2J4K0_MARPK|nr:MULTISPECIES: response regulator transcription factor [Marinitoga]AEX85942.1 response regulator with CheY-like receiver domain and winged-helix DNA-binding domain [Marinitoga piezophila KA3]APT76370.1 response regulator ArlR [Marinitoga sp. 1137]NUU96140.1 response regulator ArlR [Marinitoga sp. 1135]NUU98048.1 response regulator ArlR [Marinitoga sp. 1138]
MYKILVVEDDKSISRLLELELKHEGYIVEVAFTGKEGLEKYEEFKPDVIILDLMLPEIDGIEVADSIRNYDHNVGIIMLTAKSDLPSKIEGLKTGADDYMVKPFEIEELVARIEALLRRLGKHESMKVGNIEMDLEKMEVKVNEKVVNLTLTEFNLLKYFMQNKNVVISKEKLLEEIWGYDDLENINLVEVYINYLRKKLGKEGKKIKTVRGVGYVFKED